MRRRLIITVFLTIVIAFISACQDKKRETLPIDFNRLKESSSSYDFYIKIDDKADSVKLYRQSKNQDTRAVNKIEKIAESKLNNDEEVCFRSDSIVNITVVDNKKEELPLKSDKCISKSLLKHNNKIIFTHKSGNSITINLMGCDEV